MLREGTSRPDGKAAAGLLAVGVAFVWLLSACSAVTTLQSTGTPSPGGSASANIATPTPEVSSSTEPAASPPAGAITVELAGPPPHFVPADLSVPAGDLVFFLHNRSPGIHTLAIGHELHKILAASSNVTPGKAAAFTVHGLAAGQYVIWCTIDGHAEEGMVGTLTVT